MSIPILELKNVEYQHGSSSEKIQFPDLVVHTGDHLAVLGPSGSGKSTFLNLVGGMLKCEIGDVRIDGESIFQMSSSNLDQFRSTRLGIVFQQAHLVKSLRVKDNILIGSFFNNSAEAEINSLAEKLGIDDLLDRYPSKLSVGQMQRVSILRAAVRKPKLILADEPTASLDDVNAEKVMKLMLDLCDEIGATLVVATHDHRVTSFIKYRYEL